MLTITIDQQELWDEEKEEFISVEKTVLELEHSLKAIFDWEAIWNVPFLERELSIAESISYIKCMTLNKVDPNVYLFISNDQIDEIVKYMTKSQTATWFSNSNKTSRKEVVTAEVIFYWMTTQNIPFECQYWNIQRLITLIQVCSEKNAPPKKMSKQEIYSRNRALNAARKAKLHTKG